MRCTTLTLLIALLPLVASAESFDQALQRIYPTPASQAPVEGTGLSPSLPTDCSELEYRIQQLLPLTYDHVPGFYEDDNNGAALAVGATLFWPAYGFLGASGYARYQEQGRQAQANAMIEQLRRAKAHLHCFES